MSMMLPKKTSYLSVFIASFLFVLCSCGTSKEHENHDSTSLLDTESSTDSPSAEGDQFTTPPPMVIEIIGRWEIDNPIPNNPNSPLQDQTLEITESTWGISPLITWDNDQNFAVLQSPENDPFYAGLFHRVVWTEPEGFAVYTCQVAQGLQTVDEARFSTAKANDQDFENGCNGFPWQRLLKLED